MTKEELDKKIASLKEEVKLLGDDPKNKKNLVKLKGELAKYSSLEKRALQYSPDKITDLKTAIELYSTKQMGLFLAISEGVCRRIRKGFYASKQKYLLSDLTSNDGEKRKLALKILRFDTSKFKGINWNNIRFELIEAELDKGFWSF